jgi:hypothetical protein
MSSMARFALLLQLIFFAAPVSGIFLAWMAFHLMIIVSASIDYTPSVADPLRSFLLIVGIVTLAALGSFGLISITALRKDRGALRRVRPRHWITAAGQWLLRTSPNSIKLWPDQSPAAH